MTPPRQGAAGPALLSPGEQPLRAVSARWGRPRLLPAVNRAGLAACSQDRPGLRLAQLANFLSPTSGGLRVVVEEIGAQRWGTGERLLVVPGPATLCRTDGACRICSVAGPRLPGDGHDYHVLLRRRPVAARLRAFAPDLVEVHDQTTLVWAARWARRARVPSVLFSHERLDLVLGEVPGVPGGPTERVARRWSRRMTERFDAIVCHSDFAAEPFAGVECETVHRIPLGVDLKLFTPRSWPPSCDARRPARLVFVGRLQREKAPHTALDVLEGLLSTGIAVELLMIGSGPLGTGLRERARRSGLPVTFLGHLADRSAVAQALALSDVALSPGPRETFGLGALEAMACGTPVLVSDTGASRELLAPHAGAAVGGTPEAVRTVHHWLTDQTEHRRARRAARSRAEQFSWERTLTSIGRLREELIGSQALRGVSHRRFGRKR
ncbi:MAG: alpha,6-mannosyltransferase [Actinomycetota bacterium]|nr:alpha,6-mannosyltransferase [Actinomycetota bacterium]